MERQWKTRVGQHDGDDCILQVFGLRRSRWVGSVFMDGLTIMLAHDNANEQLKLQPGVRQEFQDSAIFRMQFCAVGALEALGVSGAYMRGLAKTGGTGLMELIAHAIVPYQPPRKPPTPNPALNPEMQPLPFQMECKLRSQPVRSRKRTNQALGCKAPPVLILLSSCRLK